MLIFNLCLFLSCDNDKERCCGTGIGYCIYKTSADYYYYYQVPEKGITDLIIYCFSQNYRFDNDTIISGRFRLENNYILDYRPDGNGSFTDLTFGELIRYCEKNGEPFNMDSILNRVIDTDPFLEFYIDTKKEFHPLENPDDFQRINEIICNGELEKYFKRLK